MTRAVANTASPSDRGVAAGCDGPDLTVNEEGEVAELSTTPPLIVGTLKVPGRKVCSVQGFVQVNAAHPVRLPWKERMERRKTKPYPGTVFANTI